MWLREGNELMFLGPFDEDTDGSTLALRQTCFGTDTAGETSTSLDLQIYLNIYYLLSTDILTFDEQNLPFNVLGKLNSMYKEILLYLTFYIYLFCFCVCVCWCDVCV